MINFIQSDIKTYLQRVDQTKNISRYIGRYDASDKYYISSNLETVFANLIQRKDLSEETIEKVKMVDKEADEIISEGKIEDVLFYFDKLDDVEKLECIQKLQNRLNR